jgi:hypothetical protein
MSTHAVLFVLCIQTCRAATPTELEAGSDHTPALHKTAPEEQGHEQSKTNTNADDQSSMVRRPVLQLQVTD